MSAQLASSPAVWTQFPPARHLALVPAAPPPPRLRFSTVGDLFAAFPTAAADVGVDRGDETSLSFIETCIEEGAWPAGFSFASYLLPRREAVWWGSRSLRRMMRNVPGAEALDAAEAWVRRPEEAERREALRAGNAGEGHLASTWIALAAGWSGGSIVPAALGHVPAPSNQAPKAVRAALLMVLSRMPAELQPLLVRPCLDHALALARGSSDES